MAVRFMVELSQPIEQEDIYTVADIIEDAVERSGLPVDEVMPVD